MKVKYVGDSAVDTKHGRLGKNAIIEVDENDGNVLLKMKNKNGKKMFVLVKEAKPSQKIKMVIKESKGE